MKTSSLLRLCTLLLAVLCFTACEKAIEDIETAPSNPEDYNICFNITHFEQIPFSNIADTRAGTAPADACTRINLAIFNNGEKVKTINQTNTDSDFGTIATSLPEGTYTVVILAHSCQGNATISSPEEIKFPNNKVTDTFYNCQTITVNAQTSLDVVLHRAVAMFQLNTTDNIPDNVKLMTFYYTGGSSTFNAMTGFGSVNSRQTETREVTSTMQGKPGVFEVYTFPHAQEGKLKMTVTASDGADGTIAERTFEEVPVAINLITRYTGEFFNGSTPSEAGTFRLTVDTEWNEADYKF